MTTWLSFCRPPPNFMLVRDTGGEQHWSLDSLFMDIISLYIKQFRDIH